MTPTFSLLHATYGRPEKAVAAMRRWWERATYPLGSIEYIVAANDDDTPTLQAFSKPDVEMDLRWIQNLVTGPFPGSVAAWDAAAKVSTGDLLVQVSDDFVPPDRWNDDILRRITARAGPDWASKPIVVRVGEHYRRDGLMTMAVCNRAYYEMQGHFLFPGYISMWSDADFTVSAQAYAVAGKCVLIEAGDIIFRHEHAYHNTAVELDSTYLRQNSSEAYAAGYALFKSRHPDVMYP